MELKHMSMTDRVKQKRYRKQAKVRRTLKIRADKNAKSPSPNMTWSSKTRSYTRKDPKRSRIAKLVDKFRRK